MNTHKLIAGSVLTIFLICSACRQDEQSEVGSDIQDLLPVMPDVSSVHPEFAKRLVAASQISISEHPTIESIVKLSRLYHANGYLQEAMACYEALLALEPENPLWKHLFAFLLSTYGYADDAELLWKEVIEADPSYVPARIRLGDVYLKSNRLDAADSLYSQVQDEHPGNPYALLGRARVAIAKEEWGDAQELLESASRHSDGKIGKDLLVTVYESLGKIELAQMIRGEAKASGSFVDIPDPWITDVMSDCYDPAQLMNVGGLAAFSGDAWKGIEWSKRALAIDPGNAMAHFQVGQLYYQTHQIELALQHFTEASKLKPDFSDAWLKQVEIESEKGNQMRAEEIFYEGFMKCPRSPAYNLQYAMRLMASGQRRQAQGYLKKSIELNPNEAAAYIQAANNLFALERTDEARDFLESALQVEPGNRLAMLTLCFYYIQSGDREAAEKWLGTIQNHPRIQASDKLDMKLKFQEKFE